ncbi:MAG: GNAT family N-acetyltransferase [Clostridiales bacterium]|nr:GNAT family N-acetyltransferase [Clostridiales bacterium]
MATIKRMAKSDSYEILDLWMRSVTKANSFIEDDFWQKHYDDAKDQYLNGKDNFEYIEDGKIVGFICVDNENCVAGIFVDPAYQNRGIGTALLQYVQTLYSLLHMNVYMKNKNSLDFATYCGFVIDGAIRNPINNEVQYTMIWTE